MTSHTLTIESRPLDPGLYLVGTPIGNLGDITLRALDVLEQADLIMAEDTRQTVKLLRRYGIRTPIVSCHKFNEAARIDRIEETVRAGGRVALVTDSGMPVVSDPGFRAVAACSERGLPVTAAPGPSAAVTALALSGMDGRRFYFGGFLPRKSGTRRNVLATYARIPDPLVFYESPHRIVKVLRDILDVLGDRRAVVAREMTKKFEEIVRGPLAAVLAQCEQRAPRGEFVIVVAPESGRKNKKTEEEGADR